MRSDVLIETEPVLDRGAGVAVTVDAQAVRIAVVGELDALGARPLQRAILDALRRHRPLSITIDLEGVTFLDTAGINTLVQSRADAGQLGCRLRLSNPRPVVYRVLHMVGLLAPFGV
jgi:anti-sigma B factor antagonist